MLKAELGFCSDYSPETDDELFSSFDSSITLSPDDNVPDPDDDVRDGQEQELSLQEQL